jgi:hypothetical protein
MTVFAIVLATTAVTAGFAHVADRVLDNFESLAPWQVRHTDDVTATLHGAEGKSGRALCMDFNFTDAHGKPINGYATARRELPLDFPDNYELSFRVHGNAGVNTLQFKLVDASGDNVWWINRPDFSFPHDWQKIMVKKRQLEFAWGPTNDRELKHSASVEFVVASGRDGGKGTVCFDELAMRALPPPDSTPLKAQHAVASSQLAGFPAEAAIDGDANSAWRSDPASGTAQHLDLDLGKTREFGGLVLHWRHDEAPARVRVQQSDDGKAWRDTSGTRARNGDDDALLLTESEARYVRLEVSGSEGRGVGLREIEVKDLDWGATPNTFFRNVAKSAPRGAYPRGFVEQSYWTIVGVDGGGVPALISEDGALQPGKAGFSIEPVLRVDGKTVAWADVEPTQSLRNGYLPMPGVEWRRGSVQLDVTAFATGTRERAQLVAQYELRNTGAVVQQVDLALAIRPFQVNPPMQFLNTPGGVAPIHDLAWDGSQVLVDNSPGVVALTQPVKFVATPLADGSIVERLQQTLSPIARDGGEGRVKGQRPGLEQADRSAGRLPLTPTLSPEQTRERGSGTVHDDAGYASGALVYHFDLAPQAHRRVVLVAPLTGAAQVPEPPADAEAWADAQREAVAAAWRDKLDRVQLTLPPQAQRLADTLRTAHAHMLMSRDGAALRPGTRSYARSWIRDGAMIADALLRLSDTDAVRGYVDWYALHQFANGKVPCCVDHRGSDPVPENDSHGELIHAIAQLYRYSGDRSGLEKRWPHIEAAIGYMDSLRASESGAVEPGAANAAFKGLMPASISHEGYSAKPMHSYWDDFWALTGYKDAAEMAQVLDKGDAATRIARARDEFARDLEASIATAVKQRGIDYIPGCAELGDFDATSTTIALTPAGEQSKLPWDLLHNTFERYWHDFAARADGTRSWNDYTPYEWRTVGSFVRLGQRERAQAAIDFFFTSGARPPAWNQWAEVVGHDAREPRFIGDMPHAWVASDFVRSTLDLFAYERADDRALVLAAGVPAEWLDGNGIAIEHLRTPYGEVSYSLKREGKRVLLRVAAGAKPPGGFVFAGPGDASGTRVAHVDGRRVESKGGEVHFAAAPAEVMVED